MDRGVSTLISILAAGSLTVAGCSAAGGQAQNGQSEQPLQTGIGQSGAKDEQDAPVAGPDGLPPGVLPPREPAQPGDARLGPDGHYDYAASDFVLTNPCDDPEIMAKLEKLGQREDPGKGVRAKGPWNIGCALGPHGLGPISIQYLSKNAEELPKVSTELQNHSRGELSWRTTKQVAPVGNSCFASIETSGGNLGFLIEAPPRETKNFHDTVCQPVSDLMISFLGEK